MKLARIVLISLSALLALILIGIILAFNGSVQTWFVRRSLADTPDLKLTVGRVSAGLHRVVLTEVAFEQDGLRLHAPRVVAELDMLRATWRRDVAISSLVAEGWSLTLPDRPASTPAPAAAKSEPLPRQGNTGASAAAAPGFAGVLGPLQLPVDLALGKVSLRGSLVLPQARGSAAVQISGGGLGVGRTATFALTGQAVLREATVAAVRYEGTLRATMDTPRTLSQLTAAMDATASGGRLTDPVAMRVDLEVHRTGQAEHYNVKMQRAGNPVLALQADFPGTEEAPLIGEWNLDLRDSDVAPFALGVPLPTFVATGAGRFETDAHFETIRTSGSLKGMADRLAVVRPTLSGVGAIRLEAVLDVARHEDAFTVETLRVAVAARQPGTGGAPARTATAAMEDAGWKPVGSVRALQRFQFNPATREVRAADPARELLGMILEGVPLAWMKPFAPELSVTGSDLRGELVATPRGGGFTFRSQVPLEVRGVELSRNGQPWLRQVDLQLSTAGDFTPRGWQAELSGSSVKSGSTTMMLLDAKAGKLVGADQPVKATGLLSVDLSTLLDQPLAGGLLAAQKGDVTVEFAASLNRKKEVQAVVSVRNLAVAPSVSSEVLPNLSATLRVDVEDDRVVVHAPIVLERGGRKSDLTLVGTYQSHGKAPAEFEGRVTNESLVIEDARVLQALMPPQPARLAGAKVPPPFWAGVNGVIGLQLKQLVHTGAFTLNHVTGNIRLSGGKLQFEGVRADVGDGGDATGNGTVVFDPAGKDPFALNASLTLNDFDPGPLLAAVNPGQPPTIEGKFSLISQIAAKAPTLDQLQYVTGDFELTSRGGTFRGLSVNVGNLVENSSKLTSWLASAGHAIGSLAGRKEAQDEITSRSQAANELAKLLSTIAYDQLKISLSRDEELNTTVKEITLISPEIRLSGRGRAERRPGFSLVNEIISFEYQLRARGRPAELMKYLGVLDRPRDDLGYRACTIPVRVNGTLARVDTTELSNRLVALAVEETGLTEKAVDWINRLRGK